jgi:hypothetical protein
MFYSPLTEREATGGISAVIDAYIQEEPIWQIPPIYRYLHEGNHGTYLEPWVVDKGIGCPPRRDRIDRARVITTVASDGECRSPILTRLGSYSDP